MFAMEVASLAPSSLRLKGRYATLVVNPLEKSGIYQAGIVFHVDQNKGKVHPEAVCVDGPGEYEIGGIKFSGIQYDGAVSYEFIIDDVSVLLIDGATLAKFHQKLHDYDIVCVQVSPQIDPSLATNVANAVVLYFGDDTEQAMAKLIKEGASKANKFASTKDKLPSEVQQIVLM